MNEAPSGTPNPRQSRYRQIPVRWSGCPVTVLLITLCCVVAAISRFGADSRPVSMLYFSDPAQRASLERLQEQLDGLDGADPEDSPEYQEIMKRCEELAKARQQPFERIARGQVWRLVTPAFLHFGPVHLICNLLWLMTLGRPLETLFGRIRYSLLVVVIAVASNIAEALADGVNFGGMSGVIYGLFGFVVVFARILPTRGLQLDPRTIRYMLIWLVLCFTGMLGPIANAAHVTGLLTGGAIGGAVALHEGGWETLRRRREFHRAICGGREAIHRCEVCGKTELHDAELEFRVDADGREYCGDHLPRTD